MTGAAVAGGSVTGAAVTGAAVGGTVATSGAAVTGAGVIGAGVIGTGEGVAALVQAANASATVAPRIVSRESGRSRFRNVVVLPFRDVTASAAHTARIPQPVVARPSIAMDWLEPCQGYLARDWGGPSTAVRLTP